MLSKFFQRRFSAKHNGSGLREGDIPNRGLQDTRSVVIPIMGPTGVGKSTFINSVLGRDDMRVGHDIESCTAEIEIAHIDISPLLDSFPWLKYRKVLLVDTPGFNDTNIEDVEILNKIAEFLKISYTTQVLGGIIYLHDLSIDRYTGSARTNLLMFNSLCGKDVLDAVILGVTKASRVEDLNSANKRITRLKEVYWHEMVDKGMEVVKINTDKIQSDGLSASDVVRRILERFEIKMKTSLQQLTLSGGVPAHVVTPPKLKDETTRGPDYAQRGAQSPVNSPARPPAYIPHTDQYPNSHGGQTFSPMLPHELGRSLDGPASDHIQDISKTNVAALAIQHELVDKSMIIPETEAGKQLSYTLRQILVHQKKSAELTERGGLNDPEMAEQLFSAQQEIERLTRQLQELKIPLGRRLLAFLRR